MTKAIRVLHKVLVNYFYTVNAGFFYFVFLLLFAVPATPLAFHLSLITGIIQSQVFLAWVMLLWLLYNLKCIDYIVKQLSHSRQSFLFCINCLSIQQIYFSVLYVQALVYLPVLVYSAAIVWLAMKNQQYWCVVEVILFNMSVVLLTTFLYVIALQKKHWLANRLALPTLTLNSPKPFFLMPLYFLWHERKQMLFVSKLFSLLLLFGFFKLYEPYKYDVRPLQLCLLLVAGSHSAAVFQVRLFEEEYLNFSRNLPLHTTRRFLQMIVMYTCLFLPELLILCKGMPIHFMLYDYPQLALQLVALLCLFHVVLLQEDLSMEQYIRIIFWILAVCFFILLYNPGLFLPVSILMLALAFYGSYYYDYEKKYHEKDK